MELVEEDTSVPSFMKLSKIPFGKCKVNRKKMPGKMKIICLNYNKLCHSCFLMGFVDSKFKFNLYHKHFPEALEKYPVLLSLLSFSILVMYVLMYAFMYVLCTSYVYMQLSLLLLSMEP